MWLIYTYVGSGKPMPASEDRYNWAIYEPEDDYPEDWMCGAPLCRGGGGPAHIRMTFCAKFYGHGRQEETVVHADRHDEITWEVWDVLSQFPIHERNVLSA